MHAGSLHLQTHNPLSKASIQLCALSQAATVTRLDTDRKLDDALAPPADTDLTSHAMHVNAYEALLYLVKLHRVLNNIKERISCITH